MKEIVLQQVGLFSHHRWLFQKLSLEIAQGDVVGILGPSGSGKSVLLKMMAGLIDPHEGRVERTDKTIGLTFQKNALFDGMNVEEQLLFPIKYKTGKITAHDEQKACELLKQVELLDSRHKFPGELSGGMQKRVALARAFFLEPSVVLLDEPTAGLDPITGQKILDLILELKKKFQTTFIFVCNDLKQASKLSQKLYFLQPQANKTSYLTAL